MEPVKKEVSVSEAEPIVFGQEALRDPLDTSVQQTDEGSAPSDCNCEDCD